MIQFRHLRRWLLFAFIITAFCGMLEWAVQQNYRMSANDPQIQIAEDTARALENGAQPKSIVGNEKIDIAVSLSSFIVIYDAKGHVLATSGILDTTAPQLPSGVLSYAKIHGQDKITWQPKPGVRQAVIVERVDGAQQLFVAVGRSLREVEKRENMLLCGITIGWIVVLAGTTALLWVLRIFAKRMTPRGTTPTETSQMR